MVGVTGGDSRSCSRLGDGDDLGGESHDGSGWWRGRGGDSVKVTPTLDLLRKLLSAFNGFSNSLDNDVVTLARQAPSFNIQRN